MTRVTPSGCPGAAWSDSLPDLGEEARALAGVAHVAVALALRLDEHRIFVTVDEDLLHREPIPRRLALRPQRIACPAEKRDVSRLPRQLPGLVVHEPDHQHFAAVRVLHDRWNQPPQLREIHKPCSLISPISL